MNILFVGNGATPSTSDAAIKTYMEGLGHTVTWHDAGSVAPSPSSYDLAVISSTSSANESQDESQLALPIVLWEAFNFDTAGITTTDTGANVYGTRDVVITDDTHDLVPTGLTGTVRLYDTTLVNQQRHTVSATETGYEKVGHPAGLTTAETCWGGIVAADGFRKAHIPFGNTAGDNWNQTGKDILEAAIAWVADAIDPTITISEIHGSGVLDSVHEAAGYNSTADELTVSGTAADTGGSGVASVSVRVNGGSWQAATGTTSWSIDLDVSTFPTGSFDIEAQATDGAGNTSTIASETVWHSPDGVWVAASTAGQHFVPVDVEGYS